MNIILKKAFLSIDFVQRFELISKAYLTDEKRLKPDPLIVKKLIQSFGYNVKCYEKGKYYEITDDIKNKYNTILQPVDIEIGCLNMQFYAIIDNELEGGQFRILCEELGNLEKVNKPRFSSYEELKILLQKHFEIYEDLKKELLKEV